MRSANLLGQERPPSDLTEAGLDDLAGWLFSNTDWIDDWDGL